MLEVALADPRVLAIAQAVKFCSHCGNNRNLEDFYKDKSNKDGLDSQCSFCRKVYRASHKKESKTYYDDNRKHILKQKADNYQLKDKDQLRIERHEYYLKNRDKILEKSKCYSESHPEVRKAYNVKNRKKLDDYNRSYVKERLATDVNFKLSLNLRNRLRTAINNNQKTGSAVRDLGCTIDELKAHLEKKFYSHPETGEEMTWENHGLYGWHIDHIKPLSLFNLENRNELIEAVHFKNLQPLWRLDNIKKGAKFIDIKVSSNV